MVKAHAPGVGSTFTVTAVLMLIMLAAVARAAVKTDSNFTIITDSANIIEKLEDASDPEKLEIAAKTGEHHIIDITNDSRLHLAFAQERVAINLDCFPLLQRIGQNNNGEFKILWSFIQFKDGLSTFTDRKLLRPTPSDHLGFHRIVVGGESNRWLNITQTVAVQGAEDADDKRLTCTVVTSKGGYYEASYSLLLMTVGAPPVIIRGNGSDPNSEHRNIKSYHIGAQFCISRDSPMTIVLECQIPYRPPLAYPNPNRTWTKDGILISSTPHGKNPDLTTYVKGRTLLMPGSLHPTPLTATKDGSIVISYRVNRISSPSIFKEGYDLSSARDDVFKFLLGTWTCGVSNSYGSDVVTTEIMDCDAPILRSPPYEVQGYCSHINWRSSPDFPCEDISGYDVRLFNPITGMEVLRRVDTHGTFYNLLAIDKDMKNESTIFQVRVVSSLFRVGPYTTAASLGCPQPKEQPTIPPPTVYFELNGNIFINNSVVNFLDVGEGDSALLCKTDKVECCGTVPNRYGEFYYPSGGRVPVIGRAGETGLYRNRGNHLIRLNRREGAVSPRGRYRCEIPDDSDVEQKIFITLN